MNIKINGESTWTTKTGKVLKMSEMQEDHIHNTIKYLDRNPIVNCIRDDQGLPDIWPDYDATIEKINEFKAELKRRRNEELEKSYKDYAERPVGNDQFELVILLEKLVQRIKEL